MTVESVWGSGLGSRSQDPWNLGMRLGSRAVYALEFEAGGLRDFEGPWSLGLRLKIRVQRLQVVGHATLQNVRPSLTATIADFSHNTHCDFPKGPLCIKPRNTWTAETQDAIASVVCIGPPLTGLVSSLLCRLKSLAGARRLLQPSIGATWNVAVGPSQVLTA